MIKFFRRIRQKLVDEGNLKRYLLYAIGEILLVVVGILIALQINNWNSNKQESKTLNGYLNNIVKNIKTDQENLNIIHDWRDSSISGSKFFMKMAEQEHIPKDDFANYFSKYERFNPLFDPSFQSDLSGFEALKNSGYLGKIQGTIIETELYKYYSIIDEIKYEEQSLNNFMEEMEYEMYKNNVAQRLRNIRWKINNNTATEKELVELRLLFKYPAFVGANSRNAASNYLNILYDELLDIGNNILSEVEKITKG